MSLENRIKRIDRELKEIGDTLPLLPEGSVYAYKNGSYYRFRGMLNGKPHYFNKRELPLVKSLLRRRYLTLKAEDLAETKRLLLSCASRSRRPMSKAEAFLSSHPLYADLLSDSFQKWDTSPVRWFDEAPYQELRTEPAVCGLYVRSKSEVMIAAALYERGLPFAYEEPVRLGLEVYYPDFTIHLPHEDTVCWYEHFGIMDDPKYVRKAYNKLTVYAAYGILPNHNLVMTFESKSRPLRITQIGMAIDMLELLI